MAPIVNDPVADPFGEHPRRLYTRRLHVLGALVHFRSNSAALLKLVDSAFAGLPQHRLLRTTPRLSVQLRLTADSTLGKVAEPPPLRFHSGGGLICATANAGNYVAVAPLLHSALVVLSRDMARFPYHARYELLEFALYTLATRCLGLVPLHAACIARNGKGLLLIGNSGTGKSTLSLYSMLAGLDLLSEDAVFAEPRSLRVSAVPTFLHLQPASLRFLPVAPARRIASKAPMIKRRSGSEKYEIDLRRAPWRISRKAVQIIGTVFLGGRAAPGTAELRALQRPAAVRWLERTQAFGRGHSGWRTFSRHLLALPACELRRGRHPHQSAEALASLLGTPRT